MPTRDKHIEYVRGRQWMSAWSFSGYGPTAAINESGTNTLAAGTILPGADTGAPVFAEISTFGYVALDIDAATDAVDTYFAFEDVDPQYPLGFRVHFATESTDSSLTLTWQIKFDVKAIDTAMIAPTTALDTTISASTTNGTTRVHQISSRGIKNGAFLTRAQIEAGALGLLQVNCSAMHTGLTANVFFLGVMMDYARQLTTGSGTDKDQTLTA